MSYIKAETVLPQELIETLSGLPTIEERGRPSSLQGSCCGMKRGRNVLYKSTRVFENSMVELIYLSEFEG